MFNNQYNKYNCPEQSVEQIPLPSRHSRTKRVKSGKNLTHDEELKALVERAEGLSWLFYCESDTSYFDLRYGHGAWPKDCTVMEKLCALEKDEFVLNFDGVELTCSLVMKGTKEEVALAREKVSRKLVAAAASNRVLKNVSNRSLVIDDSSDEENDPVAMSGEDELYQNHQPEVSPVSHGYESPVSDVEPSQRKDGGLLLDSPEQMPIISKKMLFTDPTRRRKKLTSDPKPPAAKMTPESHQFAALLSTVIEKHTAALERMNATNSRAMTDMMATMRKERKDHLRSQQETARLVAAVQGILLKEYPPYRYPPYVCR